jgi:small subunit ribosomal protein S21
MSTRIEVRRGEPIDRAIGRFKRQVNRDGVLKELRKRSRYEKPSERRRRKAKERLKSLHKAEREQRNRSFGA